MKLFSVLQTAKSQIVNLILSSFYKEIEILIAEKEKCSKQLQDKLYEITKLRSEISFLHDQVLEAQEKVVLYQKSYSLLEKMLKNFDVSQIIAAQNLISEIKVKQYE